MVKGRLECRHATAVPSSYRRRHRGGHPPRAVRSRARVDLCQAGGTGLRRDLHRYFECNQRIHEAILQAARNDKLSQTYASFANQLRRMRYSANQAHKRDRWGEAMREHEEMLDALHRRAGAEMSDILFRHLRNKVAAAIDHMEEVNVAGADALAEPF